MRKAVPIIILAAVAGLILFLLVGMPKGGGEPQPLNVTLPEKWGDFTRTTQLEGQPAMNAYQKEHVKKIPFKLGIKGEYTLGKDKFTVWIVGAVNDGNAITMVDLMTKAIGANHKDFSKPLQLDAGGVKVWRTDSTKSSQLPANYYWAEGSKVYWIGIAAPDPDALLTRIMADF